MFSLQTHLLELHFYSRVSENNFVSANVWMFLTFVKNTTMKGSVIKNAGSLQIRKFVNK